MENIIKFLNKFPNYKVRYEKFFTGDEECYILFTEQIDSSITYRKDIVLDINDYVICTIYVFTVWESEYYTNDFDGETLNDWLDALKTYKVMEWIENI